MHRLPRQGLVCALVLFISACAWTDKSGDATSRPAAHFTASAYLDHVKYLASDELGGRGVGTTGIDQAADYIAAQFKAAGCEPAGVDGTWFQPFDVRMGKKLVDDEARLEIAGVEHAAKVRHDWITLPFSETQNIEGPLAFAGYGIEADAYDYDDFADFDAKDKILLILRYEPKSDDPNAEFGGKTPSRYALFERKARTASRKGAKALLIVNPPNRDPDKDDLYEFNVLASYQTFAIPLVQITRPLADAILHKADMPDLKTLNEQLDKERKPLSKDLGLTVKLHPGLEPNNVPAKNVLARVRGAGETDETIVVGAHYDHLGTQPGTSQPSDPAKSIYHGADDNASGTAGVLELARAVKNGPPPRRNVLFITFSGEEMGLLGSQHFVNQPTLPLSDVKAMVNLDMIGRMSLKRFTVFGSTSAEEFPALLKSIGTETDIEYKAARGMSADSDHASFAQHDIPVLFFFTGIHKQYHRPEDTWDLIDADGATRVLQFAYDTVEDLANMKSGPTFTQPPRGHEHEEDVDVVKPAVEEQRAAAEQKTGDAKKDSDADQSTSRPNLSVRLGIVPSYVGDNAPGLNVQTVVDGDPAQAAGMKDGDRIIRIADEEIRDVFGFMRALQRFKPSDEVDVVVVRDKEQKTLKVKLAASNRRGGKD